MGEKCFSPTGKHAIPFVKMRFSDETHLVPTRKTQYMGEKYFVPTGKHAIPFVKMRFSDETHLVPTRKTQYMGEKCFVPTLSRFIPRCGFIFYPQYRTRAIGFEQYLTSHAFWLRSVFPVRVWTLFQSLRFLF